MTKKFYFGYFRIRRSISFAFCCRSLGLLLIKWVQDKHRGYCVGNPMCQFTYFAYSEKNLYPKTSIEQLYVNDFLNKYCLVWQTDKIKYFLTFYQAFYEFKYSKYIPELPWKRSKSSQDTSRVINSILRANLCLSRANPAFMYLNYSRVILNIILWVSAAKGVYKNSQEILQLDLSSTLLGLTGYEQKKCWCGKQRFYCRFLV